MKLRCYACDRTAKTAGAVVYTADDGGQRQFVGPDCYQQIQAAGSAGFQPPKGGPRLYIERPRQDAGREAQVTPR